MKFSIFCVIQLVVPAILLAGDPYDYKALVASAQAPVLETMNAAGNRVIDFGKDAIGFLEMADFAAGEYEVVLGEMTNAVGAVTNEYPQSSIRCYRVKGMGTGAKLFRVPLPDDKLNTRGWDQYAPAILEPHERFGNITAFRFVEVVKVPSASGRFIRKMVHYPIEMTKSAFESENKDLNAIYELCKYSILATSFCGVYVDGDRERTPYEADAYINQLDHYAIDDDYSLARKSHEWLMEHATWPTEWKQHSIKMAWADWMWSGDTRSLAKFYERLKDEKLHGGCIGRYPCWPIREDGLMVSSGLTDKSPRDIIDWPMVERDGYELGKVNAVVNAFYYRNLLEMADIAGALGKKTDAALFRTSAAAVKAAYLKVFRDEADGLYRDCEGSSHKALHANAAALAFGLVPEAERNKVAEYLDAKGLKCSVYFAQYLLEAFCEAGRADLAIKWMTTRGERSWMNMIEFGSTITMEAWNMAAKPNQDLNHAWGAAPLNVISRYILGVTPLKPGFKEVKIAPQLGGIKNLKAKVPTAKGPVEIEIVDGEIKTLKTPVKAVLVWKGETKEIGE